MAGRLYLVSTPIGNLQDMSFRAVETLRNVDLIACEDTRHTRNLLNHFRISNRVLSYHEHNERERAEELIDRMIRGESIGVVSDAGTPGISDPAFRVVSRAIESGIDVVPIPGAVAFVSAAVISGLPTDSIYFGGFLPSKRGERLKRLEQVSGIPGTLVFYEAPHRLGKSLISCLEALGDRQASVSREITKLHEEVIRGRLSELVSRYSADKVKGEVVICIERGVLHAQPGNKITLIDRVKELEDEGSDHKTALKKAAREFGISKSEAYRQMIDQK